MVFGGSLAEKTGVAGSERRLRRTVWVTKALVTISVQRQDALLRIKRADEIVVQRGRNSAPSLTRLTSGQVGIRITAELKHTFQRPINSQL
jgi:hypothetical protein